MQAFSEDYGKVLTSLEAALVALNLMLVDNMPKSVFSEEVLILSSHSFIFSYFFIPFL
jgi:hypothetical protein